MPSLLEPDLSTYATIMTFMIQNISSGYAREWVNTSMINKNKFNEHTHRQPKILQIHEYNVKRVSNWKLCNTTFEGGIANITALKGTENDVVTHPNKRCVPNTSNKEAAACEASCTHRLSPKQ